MSDTTGSGIEELKTQKRSDIKLTLYIPADATIGDQSALRVLQELSQRQLVVLPDSPLYPTGEAAAACIDLMCRSKPDPGYSKSLGRGLAVLACYGLDKVVKEGHTMLSVREISDLIDMDSSTTHRYVVTLVKHGLLVQDPASRKYMPPWVVAKAD